MTLEMAYDIDAIDEKVRALRRGLQNRLRNTSSPHTTTIVQRGIGDVLIAWENEAILSIKELGRDQFEIIAPSRSILAEPPVAVVDKVTKRRGTETVAKAYLEYLYSAEGQAIAARHYY